VRSITPHHAGHLLASHFSANHSASSSTGAKPLYSDSA
jgi:hypothetical protein